MREPATAARAISGLRRSLARRDGPLVCGPFLGEPGYETLYWIPFLRNFADPLLSEGHELVVISRGGVEQLYCDLLARGATYVDVLDLMSYEEFMRLQRERLLGDPYSRNQKQASDFELELVSRAGYPGAKPVLPSHMFALLARYPHATVCDWTRWPDATDGSREELTLVKLWFGGQLPPRSDNIERLKRWIERFADQGQIAAMVNPYSMEPNPDVDKPFEDMIERLGIPTLETASARTNLGDQIAMVSQSSRLVATYGGLAYLSVYTNTPLVAFYTEPIIVFSQHFLNFATALGDRNSKGTGRSLSVSLIQLDAV